MGGKKVFHVSFISLKMILYLNNEKMYIPYFREQFRKLFFFEFGLMYCDQSAKTIQGRKLFKGGNYLWKYGIHLCTYFVTYKYQNNFLLPLCNVGETFQLLFQNGFKIVKYVIHNNFVKSFDREFNLHVTFVFRPLCRFKVFQKILTKENFLKSVNLQYITLDCLDDGTNESSTKSLMFQVLFFLHLQAQGNQNSLFLFL